MIQIGPLTVKQHPLVAAIIAAMSDALEAMEAGDYDNAHRILEMVARPGNQLITTDVPDSLKKDFLAVRIYCELLKIAPQCLVEMGGAIAGVPVQILARQLAIAEQRQERLNDRDELALLLMFISDCGLNFELEITE